MAVETSVKNQFCKACGADVRPGALFCYSCGSAVAPELIGKSNGKTSSGKIEIGGQTAEKAIVKPDSEEAFGRAIEKPSAESIGGKAKKAEVKREEVRNKHLVVEKEAVLKTAAAVRRQAKTPPKKIEIVWEQPQNSTGIWFLIAASVLTLFAVGALLAMLYLH